MASGGQGDGAIVAIDSGRDCGDNRRMIARSAPLVLSLVLAHAAFALDVRDATTDAAVYCVVTFDLARDTLVDPGTDRPIGFV